MESDRFNRPNPESSGDKPDDNESSAGPNFKKKKKRANDLAKFIARQKSSEADDKAKTESKDGPSIWQKLLGEEPGKPSEGKLDKADKDDKAESESESKTAEPDSGESVTDKPEQTAAEPPLEELSEAEKLAVARDYVETRLAELESNNTEADPAEQAERVTLADFLRNLRDKLDAPAAEQPESVAEAADDAYAETVQAMPEAEPVPIDWPADGEAEVVPDTARVSPVAGQPPLSRQSAEQPPEPARIFDPVAPVILNPSRVEQPAEPPVMTKPSEGLISTDESHRREARAQAKGVVAGALVGYLIGRRRGRIKTEKRLNKVQAKLEKQVEDVQAQVAAKERQIKQTSRRQAQAVNRPPAVPEQAVPPPADQAKTIAARRQEPVRAERPTVKPAEATIAGRKAYEAHAEKSGSDAVETIEAEPGGWQYAAAPLAAAAELTRRGGSRIPESEPAERQLAVPPRHYSERVQAERTAAPRYHERVADLGRSSPERVSRSLAEQPTSMPNIAAAERQQLINRSAEIRFGDTNLKRVYEARLVDEAGLRRMVETHEAGGDLRRALAREFLAKELRFERDPYLHGHNLNEDAAMAGQTGSRGESGQFGTNQVPAIAQDQADAAAGQPQTAPARRASNNSVSPLLLWVLVIITILLAVYAIWLTVTR